MHTTLSCTRAADAGRGGRAGLLGSLPAAIDVSGLGSLGMGAGAAAAAGRGAAAASRVAERERPLLLPAQKGGLLGMLEQHHAAQQQQQQEPLPQPQSRSCLQNEWGVGGGREGGNSKLEALLDAPSRAASSERRGREGPVAASGFGGLLRGSSGLAAKVGGGSLDWQVGGPRTAAAGGGRAPAQRAHIAPAYEDNSAMGACVRAAVC